MKKTIFFVVVLSIVLAATAAFADRISTPEFTIKNLRQEEYVANYPDGRNYAVEKSQTEDLLLFGCKVYIVRIYNVNCSKPALLYEVYKLDKDGNESLLERQFVVDDNGDGTVDRVIFLKNLPPDSNVRIDQMFQK